MKPNVAATRVMVLVALAIAAVCALAIILNGNGHRETSIAATAPRLSQAGAPPVAAGPTFSEHSTEKSVEVPLKIIATDSFPAGGVKTQAVVSVKKPSKKKVVQDPLARDALSLVGIDPDAEEYWLAALMDPNLPKNERQDLVDDLNEQGLPDPKHPTPDDLPVLLARLQIIEELAEEIGPDLDLKEPYDDIVNLVEVAMGAGKPVD